MVDSNIDANELNVVFSSDRDGDLKWNHAPVGKYPITSQLSNNAHIISMTVTDDVGATCLDTTVVQVGTPPSATIEEPLSGEVFSVGTDILFNASFQDAEDQVTNLNIAWNSSIIGEIASGNPDSQGSHQFSTSTLGAGLHTITLTSTDSTGLVGSDTISLRVNTPPTAASVALSPDPIYSTDNLSASASGSNDTDGDQVTYTYQWYENGTLNSSTLPTVSSSELDVGEVWTVRVTPNDGYVDGPYTEQSITVSNSLPTLTTPISSNSTNIQ